MAERSPVATPMLLILCHADDEAALWLHRMLAELGAAAALVTVEQLVYSRQIVHRLTDDGDCGFVALADGRTVQAGTITGIVNRIRYLPTEHFARASAEDRAYAGAELSAFLLAWLNGPRWRVLNPPLPFALGGNLLPRAALLHHAATAGLSTPAWRESSRPADDLRPAAAAATHAVTVLDGRVFGPLLPAPIQDACRRLAFLIGVPLLHVQLQQLRGSEWLFVDASATVDFRRGGRPLAGAIAKALSA